MWDYRVGHVIDELRKMPDESIQMVVTSPPYWALRKYAGEQETIWGGDGACSHEWGPERLTEPRKASETNSEKQKSNRGTALGDEEHNRDAFCQKCGAWKGAFGLEPTIEMYVEHTVEILREIRRVLRKDGVVFWNIGDSYSGSGGPGSQYDNKAKGEYKVQFEKYHNPNRKVSTLKQKDACLIPFRVALAAQDDGWWVRSDIIWSKPNPMPESVTDRPTKSHEYIFMFTKSKDYYWNADAVREPHKPESIKRYEGKNGVTRPRAWKEGATPIAGGKEDNFNLSEGGRNIRSVWEIATEPYPEAHFATYPSEIPRRCIKAASKKGDTILDPFCGSGTTLEAARDLGRDAIGIDISNNYKRLAVKRADLNVPDILSFGGE